jgi:MFS transporter, DHA1 family, multidrug resistance protein
MGVTFAYVATSAFILESMNGVAPIVYSVDFATNPVGLAVVTLLSARLAGRVPASRLIAVGLVATAAAGLALLFGAIWLGTPLWLVTISFFVLMSAQGLVGPNAGALASDEVPDQPGTGSALLGGLQWSMAGLIAPLGGLGGDRTAVPMSFIIITLAAVALLAVYAARPHAGVQATAPHDPV